MSNKRRLPSAIPVIKRHLERVLNSRWEKVLKDPRKDHGNTTWTFGYTMQMLFYGIIGGSKNFRDVEVLSEEYGERLPDTTLHDIAIEVDAEPLKLELAKGVKEALRSHELESDFPVNITAIDGKCCFVSSIEAGDFSQRSECNGGVQYINRVLRAFHVSSATKLCVGQREIHGKSAETTDLKPFIDDLLSNYGKTKLLEVISVDAGMISKGNADYIIDKGLDYIMALKNPQKRLLQNAKQLLGSKNVATKTTQETSHGRTVVRKLYRCCPDEQNSNGWEHLQEFWRIVQTTTYNKSGKTVNEERYFVSSLDQKKLNSLQVMQAIRMHWHIENTGNWVADVAWQEDDSPFASKALVLVSLMRMLAYNITSRLLTRRLKKADARRLSWARLMELIKNSLFQLKHSTSFQKNTYSAFV